MERLEQRFDRLNTISPNPSTSMDENHRRELTFALGCLAVHTQAGVARPAILDVAPETGAKDSCGKGGHEAKCRRKAHHNPWTSAGLLSLLSPFLCLDSLR